MVANLNTPTSPEHELELDVLTGDNKPLTVSWGKFHSYLGLEPPKNRNRDNANIALEKAALIGVVGYRYVSGSNNFTKSEAVN